MPVAITLRLTAGLSLALGLAAAVPASAAPLDAGHVQALFPQTTARPLFAQTRRPVPVAPVAAAPVAPEPAEIKVAAPAPAGKAPGFDGVGLHLRGVVGRGERLIALIEGAAPTDRFRLGLGPAQLPGPGGALKQVEVLRITATQVVLRADRTVTLHLRPAGDQDGVMATVLPEDAAVALASAPQLEPQPRPVTAASHRPGGVVRTSLFTIGAAD